MKGHSKYLNVGSYESKWKNNLKNSLKHKIPIKQFFFDYSIIIIIALFLFIRKCKDM